MGDITTGIFEQWPSVFNSRYLKMMNDLILCDGNIGKIMMTYCFFHLCWCLHLPGDTGQCLLNIQTLCRQCNPSEIYVNFVDKIETYIVTNYLPHVVI